MVVVEPLRRTDRRPSKSPAAVPGTERAVVRTALLNRLCGAADGTIALIVAPAGFGAVTAQRMAQCAAYRLVVIDHEHPHPASIAHAP